MHLTRLDIHGLRNLVEVHLDPGPGTNLLLGANGSGKTSILEAIYLLGRGRSFRTHLFKPLILHGLDRFTVFGSLEDGDSPADPSGVPIGVSRSTAGAAEFRVRGRRVNASSALARELPLQLLNSDSFGLLEGGPGRRRQYLDWGVFHVEQTFGELWKSTARCLAQRNALLRRGKIIAIAELTPWDAKLSELSQQLSDHRARYLQKLVPVLEGMIERVGGLGEKSPGWGYSRGWDRDRALADVLTGQRQRDCAMGATQAGPHRADLLVRVGGARAAEVLSRGQLKLLTAVMIFAQGVVFSEITGRRCVYLLDDLGSELDDANLGKIVSLFAAQRAQAFVTGTDLRVLDAFRATAQCRVFHVEQGQVVPGSA